MQQNWLLIKVLYPYEMFYGIVCFKTDTITKNYDKSIDIIINGKQRESNQYEFILFIF